MARSSRPTANPAARHAAPVATYFHVFELAASDVRAAVAAAAAAPEAVDVVAYRAAVAAACVVMVMRADMTGGDLVKADAAETRVTVRHRAPRAVSVSAVIARHQ